MDAVSISIGCSLAIGAIVMAVAAVPLAGGLVRPNGWYGMRLPEAFASDAAWVAVNRFGGRQFIYWAVPILVVGLAILPMPVRANPLIAIGAVAIAVICVLTAVVRTMQFAAKYAAAQTHA